MANKISLREPLGQALLHPRPFGLNEDGVALHEIVRILFGWADLYNEDRQTTTRLRTNILRTSNSHKGRPDKIVKMIFDNEVSVADYSKLLMTVGVRNTPFFSHLRSELVLCLLAKRNGRYTESFLYLYRILEYISVAFPMLYALTKPDFFGSHKFLKAMMLDGKEGDLKVLRQAIPVLSRQGNLNSIVFDFDVSGMGVDQISSIKAELTAAVLPQVKNMEFETEGDILFRVPFDDMSSLFVSVRNRMFHYKISETNINLSLVGGSEAICRICLDELLYWFSLLYTEIIRVLGKQIV
ncbi:hypothetical protein [Sphingomonas faeni]|uniref:hypothetical protein n=1 Tax=Sphingomonas faeni TaxID=185950 RepID=UPI00335C2DC4